MTYETCYAHTDYPRQNCPDCHALRSSVALRAFQRDLDDTRSQFRLEEFKREYRPDWKDRKAPTNARDALDAFVDMCIGEVDAT